jgi:hypothetical protein
MSIRNGEPYFPPLKIVRSNNAPLPQNGHSHSKAMFPSTILTTFRIFLEKRLPVGAPEAFYCVLLRLVAGVRFELTTFGL